MCFWFVLGLGLGMMYLPSIVCSYRNSGSGIGAFVFSPLIEFLSEEYEWRGSLVILFGVVLVGAVFGSLIRPLKKKTKRRQKVQLNPINVDTYPSRISGIQLCMYFGEVQKSKNDRYN